MRSSHRADGARIARLRAQRAQRADTIGRVLAALRSEELQRLNVIVTLRTLGMTLIGWRSKRRFVRAGQVLARAQRRDL